VLHLRRNHGLASHADRLRARGLLTTNEVAERLGLHPSTVQAWQRAGLLAAHKANDKNMLLYESPNPDDPRLAKQQGRRLDRREPIQPRPGGAL
jgi:excisionase family DNA binding protein